MSKLAFVDFEANGFPDEDGTFRACLTYMQRTKIKFEDVFKKLDKSFKLTDWKAETDDISDANVIESTFIKIWSVYKENKSWKTQLLQTALKSHGISKNWWILKVTKTVKETQSTDHYLCYKDDIEIIDSMDQQYTIKDKDNTETAVALELLKFDETNQDHVDLVLKTVFATTILSCAILHVQEGNDPIKIIPHETFKISKSAMDTCYYQVYKQDEHYEHSISAQRIHNLGYDHLQEKGVPLERILGIFWMLGAKTTFVAHNAPIDQRYLINNVERVLNYYQYKSVIYHENKDYLDSISTFQKLLTRIKKPWICTLTAARKAYQKAIPYYADAAEEAKNELEDYTLPNLYEYITKTSMPKRHDAQMDVYACATIYYDTCNPKPKDIKPLKELISKIASDQIVCVKPIDFWRYALLKKYKNYLNNPQTNEAKSWIDNARTSKQIPHDSFTRMTNEWSWCLKYDGFYVRLKLDSTKTWKIYSRNGIEYNPPTSFLKHLTTDFPKGVEIEAELVYDTDQRCPEVDRADEKQRIVKRTKDFDKLHVSALRSKKDMSAWNGLRLVLFSFVWQNETFQESFKMGAQRIEKSQDSHPHITVCRYKKVDSTADVIEIFKSVVQMGLEGIIVRENTAKYSKEPVSSDATSTIFKMKPKIVTPQEQKFKFKAVVKKAREGGVRAEVEYEVPNFQNEQRNCTFTDSRDPGALDQNSFYSKRLKWHEQAPSKMNVWDLNNLGMRHACFATDLDLTFQVQPKTQPDKEETVKQMMIQTQPFSFIVETVYLFLDMFVYEPSVMEEGMVVMGQKTMIKIGNEHVLDIGILKLSGKTGEVVKAQTYIHKKYIRSHIQEKKEELGPTEKLFETLMQLLQHIPYDNKKFVFVVNNQHILKDFKSLGKKNHRFKRYRTAEIA